MSFSLNSNKGYSIDDLIAEKEGMIKDLQENAIKPESKIQEEYTELLKELKEKNEDTTNVEEILSQMPGRIKRFEDEISVLEKEVAELKEQKDNTSE